MADVSDVQDALVALVEQVMYPNGTGQPSVIAADVKVYAGWPQQAALDADLIAGKVNITVFPTNIERNTTRYPRDNWQELTVKTATFTLTINGQQITVAGSQPAQAQAQNAAVLVNGQPYIYAIQGADTPTSIATALAGLIPGASSVGPVITAPGKITAARVGTVGTLARETRRQERVMTLTIWAATPDQRKAVMKALDAVLATTQFLTMPDTFAARLVYRNSFITDERQKAILYRADFHYSVEFATVEITDGVQIVDVQTIFQPQPVGATAPISTVTVNT